MALNDTKTSAATELADGNSSAATEHTEEPQLAEIVNQEAGSSTAIEEIDATRLAAHPKQEPYVALALRAALREHIRKSTLNEL